MRAWPGAAVALLLTARAAAGGPPQESPSAAEIDQLTAEVAAQLRCPVCRNQSVLESSSGLAREMQSVIRDRLTAGETPDEVKAYFVSRYGDWILLKPEPKGINLLVYLLPAAALLVGGGLLVRQIRRWSGSRQGLEAAATEMPTAGEPDATAPVVAPPGPATGEAGEELSAEDERWIREQIGSLK